MDYIIALLHRCMSPHLIYRFYPVSVSPLLFPSGVASVFTVCGDICIHTHTFARNPARLTPERNTKTRIGTPGLFTRWRYLLHCPWLMELNGDNVAPSVVVVYFQLRTVMPGIWIFPFRKCWVLQTNASMKCPVLWFITKNPLLFFFSLLLLWLSNSKQRYSEETDEKWEMEVKKGRGIW